MDKTVTNDIDGSTEERIKEAARKVFTQKGYAAGRVKDIADEAGINIALLNYYFRSKEKLFDQIMLEKFQQFTGSIQQIMTDETTSLNEKLERIVAFYIDLFTTQPELPLFIFSEIKANPEKLIEIIGKRQLFQTYFIKQLQEELRRHHNGTDPLHLMMSLLSMVIFPYIGRPMLQVIARKEAAEFNTMMQERKILIPKWIEAMIKVT